MMGIPVELTLRSTSGGPRLFANPVRELTSLRMTAHRIEPQAISAERNPLSHLKVELFDMTAEIRLIFLAVRRTVASSISDLSRPTDLLTR